VSWKPINEHYEVSDEGEVRSLPRIVKFGNKQRKIKERILKKILEREYHVVTINKKKYRVSQLVAKAFCPNPNNYSDIKHIDNNKTNNKASNLKWISPEERIALSKKQINSIHLTLQNNPFSKKLLPIKTDTYEKSEKKTLIS